MQKITLTTLLLIAVQLAYAQKRPDFVRFKPVHIGIIPGLGSSGVYGIKYEHNVSINIFSGHAYANNILSIAGISHFQVQRSQGINIAGVGNILGGFPFLKGYQSLDSLAEIGGIQIAGFINGVNGGGFGGQLSGGFNLINKSFNGIQITGIHNDVNKALSGGQIALISNSVGDIAVAFQSAFIFNKARMLTGAQLFAVYNLAVDELDGLQLGVFNRVTNHRSRTYRENRFYWMQLGLTNFAWRNGDGLQVGVINYAEDIGYSQFGLINISNKIPKYPIGLVNIAKDMDGFLRAHTNRLFRYNVEIATGSKKLLNALTYSWDPLRNRTGYSYALGDQQKDPRKGHYRYFYEGFAQATHLVEKGQSIWKPNMVYTIKGQFGFNPFDHTKMPDLFFFIGIVGNASWIKSDTQDLIEGPLVAQNGNRTFWADLNFGVQL